MTFSECWKFVQPRVCGSFSVKKKWPHVLKRSQHEELFASFSTSCLQFFSDCRETPGGLNDYLTPAWHHKPSVFGAFQKIPSRGRWTIDFEEIARRVQRQLLQKTLPNQKDGWFLFFFCKKKTTPSTRSSWEFQQVGGFFGKHRWSNSISKPKFH